MGLPLMLRSKNSPEDVDMMFVEKSKNEIPTLCSVLSPDWSVRPVDVLLAEIVCETKMRVNLSSYWSD